MSIAPIVVPDSRVDSSESKTYPEVLSGSGTEMRTGENTIVEDPDEKGEGKSETHDDPPSYDFPPDGGLRAWLVVFGAGCATFTTFGYVNAWGVFQSFYQETLLRDTPPSSIAWIGSLQYALVFLPGLISGRLFDLGYDRWLFACSSFILVLATFLVAQCRVYWQFLICQGLLVGLASGGMMNPTISVITHWFKRRRQLALGFVAIGSSVGGTVIPILARNLIPRIGFQWTMRTIGFIHIVTLTVVNLTVRRRLPTVNSPGGLLNLRAFKNPAFTIYCMSMFITFLGIYTVLTYIDISATKAGISPEFAFYLVAIANAGSGVGRYVAGAMADAIGPINVMIPFTAVAGIITYAWPFANSKGTFIGLTVLYGCASGSFVTLLGSPVMEFGPLEDVGRRIGMMFTILAIGAVGGPPISGAIGSKTGGFEAVGYYAGSAVLVGVALMLVTRHLVLRKLWGYM